MISNDIYTILSSKPHNPHYLNRYLKFISACQNKNIQLSNDVYTEKHHICPKAKDLFPEYKNFKIYKWNCSILTDRQHFIAHLILKSVFHFAKSQKYAFNQVLNFSQVKNKNYDKFKNEMSLILSIDIKGRNLKYKTIINIKTGIKIKINSFDPIPDDYKLVRKPRVPQPSYIKTFHDPVNNKEYKIDTRYEIPINLLLGRSPKFKQQVSKSSKGNKGNINKNAYNDGINIFFLYNDDPRTKKLKKGGLKYPGRYKNTNINKGKNNPMYGKIRNDKWPVLTLIKNKSIIETVNLPAKDAYIKYPRKVVNIGIIDTEKLIKIFPRTWKKYLDLIDIEIIRNSHIKTR